MNYLKIALFVLIVSSSAIAQSRDTIVLKDGLYLKSADTQRRGLFANDPVEEKIVSGKWKIPVEGDSVSYGKNSSKWVKILVNKEGWFEGPDFRSGYLSVIYDSPVKQKVLLAGFGYSMVYVNGALHFGNRYGSKEKFEAWEPRFDYSLIPVELKKGKNEFLFVTAGKMKAKLIECGEGIIINTNDTTLPDLIASEENQAYGSIVLINTTNKPLRISIGTSFEKSPRTNQLSIWEVIQPMSLRKVPFSISFLNPEEKRVAEMKLMVFDKINSPPLAQTFIQLRIVNKNDNHKVTFFSDIDGSVQYYSVNPARNNDGKPKALFLSIHGAGVEAINQSGSYFPKTWGHIVAATNRRPYGFNWEDWGRIDAMEVYDQALKTLNIDSSRIYLTGHSMGGHGTWHLGALYPDKFAAIAPSAGWVSFWSYRVREKNDNPSPMENMLMRSTSPSDTYGLSENYKQEGIYIIHGEKDDNVPPTEARNMVENLKKFHNDYVYYEQPGAGHWWDNSDEDGADCVDWMPLFDFFARHSLPKTEMVRDISFITPNPEVSFKDHWLVVISQLEQLKLSKVNIHFDPGKNRFIGKTENVSQLALLTYAADVNKAISIEIDGQKINIEPTTRDKQTFTWISKIEDIEVEGYNFQGVLLQKKDGVWCQIDDFHRDYKNPLRYGTLKSTINHQVVFVYGTKGNKEENEWAFNKARYDAEQFWYQGNGAIKVIQDIDYDEVKRFYSEETNVVIYGNSETNAAWNKLLKDSPVQITSGKIKIGEKEYKGKDLACMFVRPIAGTADKTVGVISGSGIKGMKLTDRRNYMQPGSAFPDITLFNSDIITKGIEGVLASGFFGLDWSVDKGEIVYK